LINAFYVKLSKKLVVYVRICMYAYRLNNYKYVAPFNKCKKWYFRQWSNSKSVRLHL